MCKDQVKWYGLTINLDTANTKEKQNNDSPLIAKTMIKKL